jgi:hypothetical protein
VILAEERTTEEERQHIMEARKRTAIKKKKMRMMGKSRSTETDEEDEDAEEGRTPFKTRREEAQYYPIQLPPSSYFISTAL